MATSGFNAATSFSQVYSKFVSSGDPILTALKNEANTSAANVRTQDYLTTTDLNILTQETPIVEPSEPGSVELFSAATQYLEWLDAQALLAQDIIPPIEEVDLPGAPAELTLDIDSIEGRLQYSEIAAPFIQVPEWDEGTAWSGQAVIDEVASDTIDSEYTYTEPTYTSSLIGDDSQHSLYKAILDEIQSKSYGIDPAEEDRLFTAMRDREAKESQVAIDGAMAAFSAGGFTVPPGAMLAAVARIRAEARDKVATANREMASKRADLYLEAKKIAHANGLQVEEQTQKFHNAFADRMIKAAVDGIQMTVAIAAQNAERAKLFIQKYTAFAQAFEARVRASTATVDLYKAQVEAETSKAAFNKSLVDEFVSRNQAVVQSYEANVKGYAAEVDAKVRYYSALVESYKSKASEIEYRARAMNGVYDLAEKGMSNIIQYRVGKYNADIAYMKATADKLIAATQVKLDQIKSELQSNASLAAAAMAAMNVNLGLSVNGAASVSGSESKSESSDLTAGTTRISHSYDMTAGTERRSRSTNTNTSTNTSTNKNYAPDAPTDFSYTNNNTNTSTSTSTITNITGN